eukprot:scaffold39023_cov36-Phaeocystis_antarctica.AAC.1
MSTTPRWTKRSIVDNTTSGIAPPPRAWSIQTGQCSAAGRTHATSGCAAVAVARSGGHALKQERVPELRSGDVSVVRARCASPVMNQMRRHESIFRA